MIITSITILHILSGTVAILFGATALFSQKGSRLHRSSGQIFGLSMLVLAVSSTYIAYMKPVMISVIAGIFTGYLVATAWMTIHRKPGEIGRFEFAALLVTLTLGITSLIFGWEALNSEAGLKDGYAPEEYFFFATLALLATSLDIRMLIRRGITGAHRLARHLWRMTFALFIATGSLFTGPGMTFFPEAIRQLPILNLPEIIVLIMMIFWLVRVLFTKRYKKT